MDRQGWGSFREGGFSAESVVLDSWKLVFHLNPKHSELPRNIFNLHPLKSRN